MTYRNGKAALVILAALVAGCDSGSFGSDVESTANTAPIAEVQILNGNGSNEFRTGAEVFLTGKSSEDPDGPILGYVWRHLPQAGQSEIQLIERTANTVSFTMPNLPDGTTLQFELTVEDSSGTFSSNTVSVVAREALDANRFLSMKIVGETVSPRIFDVQPYLAQTITTEDPSYTVDVDVYRVYPRLGSGIDCRAISFDPNTGFARAPSAAEIAQGFLAADANCLVALQENLTGPAGLSGSWPVGVAPDPNVSDPRHTFQIPMLDVDEFNQPIIDAGRRADRLELYTVPGSYGAVRARITPATPANLSGLGIIVNQALTFAPYIPPTGGPLEMRQTTDFLLANIPDTETATTAQDYYSRVDPFDERLSLNRWLCVAGFADDAACAPVLAEDPNAPGFEPSVVVPLKPEAEAGTDVGSDIFAHATYLNNYDLGFGRDMYTRVDTQTGYVYAFVDNYTTLEGAIRRTDPIVAVVMEFTPPQISRGVYDTAAEPFVKFYTYAPDGTGDMLRVTSMNFDGRGEIPTPGNCVVCHGGNDPGDPANVSADGNVGATFLPWDPDSLLFLDDDPAIADAPVFLDGATLLGDLQVVAASQGRSLDRASQMAQIKKFNEAALNTYVNPQVSDPTATSAAVELVDLFYDGAGFDVDPVSGAATLNGAFAAGQVPAEWDEVNGAPAGSNDIYVDVYALHCRMCHTNVTDVSLRFDSYAAFAAEFPTIVPATYERGVMPGARLTTDRFWIADGSGVSPGAQMAAYLQANVPLPAAPTPPAATAVIDTTPAVDDPAMPVAIGTRVQLDGSASLFADDYAWTVTRGGQAVAVTGNTTVQPTFLVDAPGDYSVQLDINGGADSTALAFTVINIPPTAVDDNNPALFTLDLTLCETQPATCRNFDSAPNSVLDNDADPDDPDGGAPNLVVSRVTGPGNDPVSGTVALSASGEFIYAYTGVDIFSPPPSDSFVYRIDDPFGASDTARVTVTISAADDNGSPTSPTGLAATEASTTGASSDFRVALTWGASTDAETGVNGYNVYTVDQATGAFSLVAFRTVAQYVSDGNGFTATGLSDDTPYTFSVRAVDNAGNLSPQNTAPQASQRTDVSYRLSIHPVWSATTFNCTLCHTGTAPSGGLLLNGTTALIYDCLRGNNPSCNVGVQADRAAPAANAAQAASRSILCDPALTCSALHPAVGFDSSDADYQRISRWLQQGSQEN